MAKSTRLVIPLPAKASIDSMAIAPSAGVGADSYRSRVAKRASTVTRWARIDSGSAGGAASTTSAELIIAVAAFNLVSTLVMTVTDKQADIAILRTLGASPGSIMKIFMIQGALVGLLGTFIGVSGGVLVALNVDVIVPFIESLFGVQFLPRDIYLISALPSDLRWPDVGRIAGVAVVLAFFATLYPSWRAARVRPAEALRYE